MVEFAKEELEMIENGDKEVMQWVRENVGWIEEEWPKIPQKEEVSGEAYVKAHPILGIEKYLGMCDKSERLAWFPSLKFTNDSFTTKTWIKFDPSLSEDVIIFGDELAGDKDRKRYLKIIDKFREWTGCKTKCVVVSKHIPKIPAKAKGLGLSAASGGAAAKAIIEAALPELNGNKRFLNVLSRYLSGSSTSSSAGGFSVWFSHYGIDSKDSFAIRLDEKNDVKLVVVPIPKSIHTANAHDAAQKSELYKYWATNKPKNVLKLMEAIKKNDVHAIGMIAELDSLNLFHLLVSGDGFFNWNDITLAVLTKVIELRKEHGLCAYCSMDTGPSVAIITNSADAENVKSEIEAFLKEKGEEYPVYIADEAGAPEVLPLEQKKELLTDEVLAILKEKGVEV
ncbi:MAG: hypothetical protein GXO64_04520 [Candidatus Micrarchaeota archaeon]|nr:hypothetical protein [Candidatus Micrarchaeota archaeon]